MHRRVFKTLRGHLEYIVGGIFSLSGNVQNIRGIPVSIKGYHKFIEGCSLHWMDIESTFEGYHYPCEARKKSNFYNEQFVRNAMLFQAKTHF